MKTFLLTILLATGLCFAEPKMIADPNSVIQSPDDPDCVRVTVVIELTKEHAKAMKRTGTSLQDVFRLSRVIQVLDELVEKAKADLIKSMNLSDLEKKIETE
ncbi:MAG: hypothetical protein ACYS7Y_29040 [Planctomycetota bacterium]|jgi:hypothetical protein